MFLAIKVVQVVQIGGRGRGEVIWTSSKRTATFFRETFPYIIKESNSPETHVSLELNITSLGLNRHKQNYISPIVWPKIPFYTYILSRHPCLESSNLKIWVFQNAFLTVHWCVSVQLLGSCPLSQKKFHPHPRFDLLKFLSYWLDSTKCQNMFRWSGQNANQKVGTDKMPTTEKSWHFVRLAFCPTTFEFCTDCWSDQSCYIDFSKSLHGFVKIDTWISLICYLNLSKLIHGFL